MPRIVKLSATGPVKIEPGHEKPVWVCACGLSRSFPICDGSHKTTAKQEDPTKTYHYDPDSLQVLCACDPPPPLPPTPTTR
jgi:CDGSH-type Zn-finger protein